MGRSRFLRYSAAVIVLALIIFTPVALLAAAIIRIALVRLRLLPSGVSGSVAYLLLTTLCLGAPLLWLTLDDLVLRPAQMQRELVGRQLVSPLQLRRYETFGFQDPHYEWHYAVGPDLLRQLRPRCRHPSHMPATLCVIDPDGDASQSIGLDGDTLWIESNP